MDKPLFTHPAQKHLETDPPIDPVADTEDEEDTQFFNPREKYTSIELDLLQNDNKKKERNTLTSTFDSVKRISIKGEDNSREFDLQIRSHFSNICPELEPKDDQSPQEKGFRHLPNFEDIKHFEQEYTDKEFLDIVVARLQKIEEEVTYKIFKGELLPSHRKPTFREYLRFRLLEKEILRNGK